MEDLTKQQEQRTQLLRALHEATKGDTVVGANYSELGAKLGLSQEETSAAVENLVHVAKWALYSTLRDACMTAEGVKEIERTLQAEQSVEPLRLWRDRCGAKTIDELQDGLDRGLYTKEKAAIARTVLDAKREAKREQGEVATLKREIADLKTELRDKRATLLWTRIAALITTLSLAASWKNELGGFFKWATAALLGR